MNPLLYKAHPLLHLTVDLLVNPAEHHSDEVVRLILIYLAVNLVWSAWLWQGIKNVAGFPPSYFLAYALSLPAVLFYLPTMLTILNDIIKHEFHFAERMILVICVFIATQMLGGFYAVAIRYPRNGIALGLVDGLAVSLWMWLFSLPIGLALLWLNGQLQIV